MGEGLLLSPDRDLVRSRADVRATDARRAYLEAHAFELLIAVLAAVSALAFFLDPGALARSPIGRTVHPFDTAWNVLYLAGSALVVAGLVRPSYRLEVAGLLMLSSAIATGAVAVIAVRGVAGASSITIYVAAAAACLVRVRVIQAVERAVEEANVALVASQERRERRR